MPEIVTTGRERPLIPEEFRRQRLLVPPEIAAVLDAVPLQTCTFERNPVTREIGWRAPEGYVFRAKGKLKLGKDGIREQASFDEFDNRHWHKLIESKEEGQTAIYNDQSSRFRQGEFNGTWLVIAPNIDGTASKYDDVRRADQWRKEKEARLFIKGDIFAFTGGNHEVVTPHGFPNITEKLYYSVEAYNYGYGQEYAEGKPGKYTVELVEATEGNDLYEAPPLPEPELILPPPEDRGLTSWDYMAQRELYKGIPATLNERVEGMRDFRNAGTPLSDDVYTRELVRRYVEFPLLEGALDSPEMVDQQIRLAGRAFQDDEYRPCTPAEKYGRVTVYVPRREKIIRNKAVMREDGVIEIIEEPSFF